MNKKTLGIILVVLIIVIAGLIYLGYQKGLFTKEGIGGIDKNSVMGAMKEKGETVMSKSEYIDGCKKSDADTQDMCYGMGAFYYRDASFCKWIKDSEAKKNCNQENIEKMYSDLEKGISPFGGLIPGGGTLPGGGIIPGGEPAQPEPTTENQEKPIVSGKMTDEIYIEILAQSSNYSGDPNAYASRIKALYEKYGVTEEDIKAYASELEKDPQRAAIVAQKYMQRAMELRNTGK